MALMSNGHAKVSNYLYAKISAEDDLTQITTTIDAVIRREDLAIVYWHRN